jgi:ABC-type dipeptide/oligopeptide/nickel transport system permease component
MLQYLLARMARIVPTLLLAVTLIFVAARVLPGDPAEALLGQNISQQAIETLRHQLGLNEPLWKQYLGYMGNLLQGDLGRSLVLGNPIIELLAQVLPFTAIIVLGGIGIGVALGIPLGILCAVYRNSWIDYVTRLATLGGVSMPGFVIGIILMGLFSVWLGWLPMVGGGEPGQPVSLLRHALLPCLAGGLAMAAYVTRLARSTMLEVLREDYVRTARAKGLAERWVLYKHALRNAFIPILTLIGIYTIVMVGDSITIEIVFSRPGFGRLIQGGIAQRDYTMLQSILMLYVAFAAIVNLILDLVYGFLDPRIKYTRRES